MTKNLYVQIKEWIIDNIRENVYKPGSTIPSEFELTKIFSVSRSTVNKAITDLVHEGYLSRKQGIGTFVENKELISRTRVSGLGFKDEMELKGLKIVTRPLSKEIIFDEQKASILNLKHDAEIFKYSRLRILGNDTIAYQTSYVPNRYATFTGENDFSQHLELYKYLKSKGYSVAKAKEIYSIEINHDLDVINEMGIDQGTPVYHTQRYSKLSNGNIIEYVESYLAWDFFQIEIELDERGVNDGE